MITDEMLKSAAAMANEALMRSLPSPNDYCCAHEFSINFEKKMNKLIHRTRFAALYKFLKAAACFFLIIAIGIGAVLTFNIEARAAFFGWFKKQYETFVNYYFAGESYNTSTDTLPDYELGWLPEGYVEVKRSEITSGLMITYSDSYNNIIHFSYSNNLTSITNIELFISQETHSHSIITINGTTADLYLSNIADKTNVLVWEDSDYNIIFNLSAFLSEDELVRIAENITK